MEKKTIVWREDFFSFSFLFFLSFPSFVATPWKCSAMGWGELCGGAEVYQAERDHFAGSLERWFAVGGERW